MSVIAVPQHRPAGSPMGFLRDMLLLTGRSVRTIPRVPERLLDVTIQPIVFILLFLYVFGSAIHVPGLSYKDYMFPGIIGQSLAFGVIGAGVATSNDFTDGVGYHSSGSWQLSHPELAMVLWCPVILAICVPLALRRFNRTIAG